MASRPTVLAAALTLLGLLFAGCACGDPCEGVECPAGEVCEAGACTDTPDGGLPDGGSGEVPCARDLDCAGVTGRTHCDALSQSCVQCYLAAHCPTPETQTCNLDSNRCVSRPPCGSDADCADLPASSHCETGSGSCVPCTEDAHCPGTQRTCGGNFTCRFDACTEDADCADYEGLPHCNVRTGYCRACTESAHCGEQETCTNGVCQPEGECTRDADCGPGEQCHTLLGQCVGCVTFLDCSLGGRCLGFQCQPTIPCQGDVDCGALLHCDAARGACVQCTTGAHCAQGQSCDETGFCAAPATCGPSALCRAGEACEDGACVPATCDDDALEQNALPYEAHGLVPGLHEGLVLCPNDWDWYVLDAAPGDGLRLALTYDRALGDPELRVWQGTGSEPVLVGQPQLTVTGQRVEVSALPQPGPVWVGLRGRNEALAYALEATVLPGGLCSDDGYEPNDGPFQATPLPAPVAGETSLDATGCAGDEDWFSLAVPADLRVVASAEPTDGGAATSLLVSLFVREEDGLLRLVGGAGTHVAEGPAEPQAAAWLARVVHTTAGARSYRLRVALRPPRPGNDACAGATDLLAGGGWLEATTAGATDHGSTACGGDGSADVTHSFTLAEPRAVVLTAEGGFDAVLGLRGACDDPESEVACSDAPGASETLSAVLPAGTFTVWVDGFEGREGDYRIRLDTAEAPPAPGNETCAQGAPLDVGAGGGTATADLSLAADDLLAGCGLSGGDVVYLLDLSTDASLFATLEGPPGASLSLRAVCEDPASEAACAAVPADTGDGAAALDLPYVPAGAWALVVDGGGPLGGPYTLTWGLGSAVPPPSNDDCATALALDLSGGAAQASGNTRSAADDLAPACASAVSGGDVVYALSLADEGALRADLTAGFDAVLELRGAACTDPAASLVCADQAPPSLFVPSLAPGAYHLVVDGYAGGAGPFDLAVTLEAARPVPVNDLCAAAGLLDVSSGAAVVTGSTFRAADDVDPGAACTGSPAAGPDVFYAVDLLAGQTLTATVSPASGYDPAVYLLDACDGACLAGADALFVSEPETVVHGAAADQRVIIGVDAWSGAEAGDFELTLSVQ